MALTPKLEIRQSPSLLLTPRLRQAISLLQMNNLELSEAVEQELLANPLLEREDDRLTEKGDSLPDTAAPEPPPDDSTAPDQDIDSAAEFDDFGSDTEGYEPFETADWSDYGQSKIKRGDDDSFDFFEKKLTRKKSLYDMLDEQINQTFTAGSDRLIAKILSERLDAAGYFRGDTKELATGLKTSPERLNSVLSRLKQFEPAGIFAENLAECLKIQLQDRGALTAETKTLLDNLPLLAARRFKELAALCGCSVEQILSAAGTIKSLNPKPAADFAADPPSYVVPDVFIRRNRNGEYRVELNNMTLPRLLINHDYYTELKKDRSAARYLKENLSHANFLIKALRQRATTILRVAEEIVLRQYHFFEQGIDHLRPMTLKDVAGALSLSESTVSRITAGKYLAAPNGLFELKYFFSAAAGSYIGEDASTTVVKHKIKTLIDAEDPAHILSDDKIVELLEHDGIKIARRTVAKYRDALGIPTSGSRKRAKRLQPLAVR